MGDVNVFEITDYGFPLPDNIEGHKAYRVIGGSAPLFGMPNPSFLSENDRNRLFKELHKAGVRVIINLTKSNSCVCPDSLDFEYHVFPLTDRGPEPDEMGIFWNAVEHTMTALKYGQGVVIHCQGGTGRTGTVLGCVLRKLEKGSGNEIVAWLGKLNARRGRTWPESDIQGDLVKNCKPDITKSSQEGLFDGGHPHNANEEKRGHVEFSRSNPDRLSSRIMKRSEIPPGFTGIVIAVNGDWATVKNKTTGELFEIPCELLRKADKSLEDGASFIRRIAFFDLEGTLIKFLQSGESSPIENMPQILSNMSDKGWEISIISSHTPENIKNLLKESDFKRYEYFSSAWSTKGNVISNLINNVSYGECIFVDDNPGNLDSVSKVCMDKVRIIGFAGNHQHMPELMNWCQKGGYEFAASPAYFQEKLT